MRLSGIDWRRRLVGLVGRGSGFVVVAHPLRFLLFFPLLTGFDATGGEAAESRGNDCAQEETARACSEHAVTLHLYNSQFHEHRIISISFLPYRRSDPTNWRSNSQRARH